MKKSSIYLLALLLLLSACNKQGEAKITITATTADNQRADVGATLYFVPAHLVDSNYLGQYLKLEEGLDKAQVLKERIDFFSLLVTSDSILLSEGAKSKYRKEVIYSLEKNRQTIKEFKELIPIVKKERETLLENAKSELALFLSSTTKTNCDVGGVGTLKIEPGKYKVLIESNICNRKNSFQAFKKYYLDNIVIQKGQTTTLSLTLNNCE